MGCSLRKNKSITYFQMNSWTLKIKVMNSIVIIFIGRLPIREYLLIMRRYVFLLKASSIHHFLPLIHAQNPILIHNIAHYKTLIPTDSSQSKAPLLYIFGFWSVYFISHLRKAAMDGSFCHPAGGLSNNLATNYAALPLNCWLTDPSHL